MGYWNYTCEKCGYTCQTEHCVETCEEWQHHRKCPHEKIKCNDPQFCWAGLAVIGIPNPLYNENEWNASEDPADYTTEYWWDNAILTAGEPDKVWVTVGYHGQGIYHKGKYYDERSIDVYHPDCFWAKDVVDDLDGVCWSCERWSLKRHKDFPGPFKDFVKTMLLVRQRVFPQLPNEIFEMIMAAIGPVRWVKNVFPDPKDV
jgi:hypothetical protein